MMSRITGSCVLLLLVLDLLRLESVLFVVVSGLFLPTTNRITNRNIKKIQNYRLSTFTLYEQAAASANDYNNNNNNQSPPPPSTTTPTLYDLLGAQPTDTRAQLKQKYVALAKQSHPDAIRNNIDNNNTTVVDFAELAAAWRILSDTKQRRRYDRNLQAAQFSQDVTEWAEKWGREAVAPLAVSIGKMAMPFLRKTTAATVASFQAATQPTTTSTNNNNNRDFSQTFQNAMRAARRAGRFVDSLELTEKAQELEQRANAEMQQALQVKREIQNIAQERLNLVLYVPGSGITSDEAMLFWNDFNQTVNDEVSVWDRALRQRHRIEYEIETLKAFETEYLEAQRHDSQAQEDLQKWTQAKIRAQQEIIRAERDEMVARRALLDAQQRAADARVQRAEAERNLQSAEQRVQKMDTEMERRSLALVRQSEKVRKELRSKARRVHEVHGTPEQDIPQDQSPSRLQDLKELRRQERILQESARQMEQSAERLMSRVEKLRVRAAELEAMAD